MMKKVLIFFLEYVEKIVKLVRETFTNVIDGDDHARRNVLKLMRGLYISQKGDPILDGPIGILYNIMKDGKNSFC